MDTQLIEEAIRKAIKGGAVLARANPLLPDSDDTQVVRTETEVDIEPQVFEDYISDLKRDEQMARFDSAYTTTLTGYGSSTSLNGLARLLLARALATGDVGSTVNTLRSYVEQNVAPVIAVMAISGVKTERPVRLGPEVQLLPLASLPPSFHRWGTLGHTLPGGVRVSAPASSALVVDLNFGPIFYWPTEGGRVSAEAQHRARRAIDHLDEARMLLSLLGIPTAVRTCWLHAKDPLMRTGTDVGWLTGRERLDGQDVVVNVEAAEELAAAYFRMDPTRRKETIHIPLDRLDKAFRGDDLVDRAIDLGIALEALLLHELEGENRGELRFRLSLRGAWLAGNDAAERAEIQKTLGKVYDLRSTAVHTGKLERTDANETIKRGTALCRRLIRKMIEADGRINWSTLLVGGS